MSAEWIWFAFLACSLDDNRVLILNGVRTLRPAIKATVNSIQKL